MPRKTRSHLSRVEKIALEASPFKDIYPPEEKIRTLTGNSNLIYLRWKTINSLFPLLLFILFSWLTFCSDSSETVLTIGSWEMNSTKFKQAFRQFQILQGKHSQNSSVETFVNDIITRRLILEAGYENGWDAAPEFLQIKNYLEQSSRRDVLFEREILDSIQITESEVQQYFRLWDTEIDLRHLVAPTAEAAYHLRKRLLAGESWQALAGQVFQDTILQQNGGSLGWTYWTELEPHLAKALIDLPLDSISHPVRSRYGYHILKIDNIRYNPVESAYQYTVHREKMRGKLFHFKKRILADQYIFRLKDTHNIKIKRQGLQKLYELVQRWQSFLLKLQFNPPTHPEVTAGHPFYRELTAISEVPLVTSNRNNMRIGEFMQTYFAIPADYRPPLLKRSLAITAISDLYMNQLLDSLARARGITAQEDPDFEQKLDDAAVRFFKKRLRQEFRINSSPAEGELRRFYESRIDHYLAPDSVAYIERRFPNRAAAAEFLNAPGGDAQLMSTGQQVQHPGMPLNGSENPLHNHLKGLDTGAWSRPIQTASGVVLLKVTGRKNGKPLPFRDIKSRVRRDYQQNQLAEALKSWLEIQKNRQTVCVNQQWISRFSASVKTRLQKN